MAAVAEICESNGAGETISHNVANVNMGSTDASALNAVTYPVAAGNNSYEKWLRLHITSMGGSSKIDNLKFWRTGSLSSGITHVSNARTTSYGGAPTYATPIATASTVGTVAVPTSTPASANLGIAGVLNGSLTGAGYSDYLVTQMQVSGAAVAGQTTTFNFQYDETA